MQSQLKHIATLRLSAIPEVHAAAELVLEEHLEYPRDWCACGGEAFFEHTALLFTMIRWKEECRWAVGRVYGMWHLQGSSLPH